MLSRSKRMTEIIQLYFKIIYSKIKPVLYLSVIIAIIVLIIFWFTAAYSAEWTGFGSYTSPNGDFVREKTLWNWMELLIIPLFLATGAFFLNRSERKNERIIAIDHQRELALQSYIDRIAELILKNEFHSSDKEYIKNVAKVRTLSTLRGLDSKRKGILFLFLLEAGLITKTSEVDYGAIINLKGADLSSIDLMGINLSDTYLPEVNLRESNLISTNLRNANLEKSDLTKVDLINADLSKSNLSQCRFHSARMNPSNLEGAIIKGAGLVKTTLRLATLKNAIFTESYFDSVDLSQSDLTLANLDHAIIINSNLKNANLVACQS